MKKEDIGLNKHRLKAEANNPRERIFVDEWHKEHQSKDRLRWLLYLPWASKKAPYGSPTERDRVIVETVIQWLGSPVGFCFLSRVLQKCGYKIEKV